MKWNSDLFDAATYLLTFIGVNVVGCIFQKKEFFMKHECVFSRSLHRVKNALKNNYFSQAAEYFH